MTSRRIFLKHGAFAFVSLGFAPSFLARTAFAAGASRRPKQLIAIFQRGAVDGLSVVVPFGETDYYRARPSIAIGRPGSAGTSAIDLDGFFGLHPRLQPLKPLWDARAARDRARVRIARQHAVALRRAGLHGERDARGQEHAGRLAQSLPSGAARSRERSGDAVPGGRADHAAAAHASGDRAGARDEPGRAVRHPRRAGQRHGRRVVRSRVRRGRRPGAARHRPRCLQRHQDAEERPTRRSTSPRTASSTRAARSGRRCGRSRSSRKRTSGSRSRSRTSAAGTPTRTRAPRKVSSPRASTTSRARSPRSSPTSAIGWRTPSC